MVKIVKEAASRAGGIVALARELGIRHTALYSWKQIPANRVADVSRVTGIPPHELRPDLADIFLPRSKQGERA